MGIVSKQKNNPPLVLATILLLAACASPTTPTPAPSPRVAPAVATPSASPMPTATTTRIPTATPTAFVTAPAPDQAAIVPILMYHNLRDLPNDASELQRTWTVAPKHFEAQMNYLAQRGFRTITMAQLIAHLRERQPLPVKPIVISFDDGWREQYTVAFPILKKYGLIGTFFVYTNPLGYGQFLTWTQLQEMATAGMDIQSHTLSHPHLRTLAPDAAMKEIAESKALLERRLGKPVMAFSYPYGEYDPAVIEMLKRAGYASAVTLATGYRQRADELFALRRIRVSYADTLEEFAGRLPQ